MNFTPRILANTLVFVYVVVLAIPVSAESGITISGVEIPWGVISTSISALAAIVTLLLRSSLATMRIEFNSQMTAALAATLEKGRAEGALEERQHQEAITAARAAGVVEEKGRTPPATPLTGGSS